MGVVSNITRRRHLTDLQRSWRLNNLSHCWTLLRIVEHCWAFLTNLSHCSMQRAKLGGWAMPRRRYQLNHPLCTLVHTVHNLANKKTKHQGTVSIIARCLLRIGLVFSNLSYDGRLHHDRPGVPTAQVPSWPVSVKPILLFWLEIA